MCIRDRSETLTVADFRQLGPQIDAMIDRNRRIRVLIDATEFGGWENFKAFEVHTGFVKLHQMYVCLLYTSRCV